MRPLPVARAVAAGAYIGALVVAVAVWGLPLDREQVLAWLVGAMLIAAWGPPAAGLRVVRDWLPFALLLLAYDYSRGIADQLGRAVAYRPQLRLDEILFGVVPTVWLQERLYRGNGVAWWEVVLSATYLSHFIVAFVVAAVLWLRDRAVWRRFTRRLVALSFLAFAIFVVFPSAPPWLASRVGLLPAVARTAGRGLQLVGLGVADRLLEKGRATVNLTAAVPSLHAAYALLVSLTLWPRARRGWKPLLVVYPVAMGFCLVATGEHYVSDILAGWLAVAVVCGVDAKLELARATRRARRSDVGPGLSGPAPAAGTERVGLSQGKAALPAGIGRHRFRP